MRTLAALLVFVALPARAVVITGRFDASTPPAFGAWQSVVSADQAIGVSKPIYHIAVNSVEAVRLGLFLGGSKPLLSDPPAPIAFLGGLVVTVPGSLLDLALGTHMGDLWVPRLKTGVLLADDLTRPSQLHLRPSFAGIGAAWPFGGG